MKNFFILIVIIVSLSSATVWAFNDTVTHPELTKRAVSRSQNLTPTYLKDYFDIDSDEKAKTITSFLQDGSILEDDPACRASNHFHNPLLEPWNNSGLSDPVWFIDTYCKFTDYPSGQLTSAVHWATGYISPTENNLPTGNDMDWKHARQNFYFYFTEKNRILRYDYLSLGFINFGYVLHMLQDMAVPEHVRNDFNNSHLKLAHKANREWLDILTRQINTRHFG